MLTGTANVPNTSTGSGTGNATISFNATGIRSITFTFDAGGNAAINPTFQEISLHDVTFTPVPEVNPMAAAGLACMFGLLAMHRRRLPFYRERTT